MAQVKGFDPAVSGQQPEDINGNPVPVGVWGDSSTAVGVFGTSGVLPQGTSIPIKSPAGVEGHGVFGPGVVGRSLNDDGVVGEGAAGVGLLCRQRLQRCEFGQRPGSVPELVEVGVLGLQVEQQGLDVWTGLQCHVGLFILTGSPRSPTDRCATRSR